MAIRPSGFNPARDKYPLKNLLNLSRDHTVFCAVGVVDGVGVIKLDLHRRGRKLLEELTDYYGQVADSTWGTAKVEEAEPKVVVLTVRQLRPSLARRLRPVVRHAEFEEVVVQSEADEEG